MKAILSSLRNIVLFTILLSSYEFANAQCTVAGTVTGGATICSGSSSPTMTLSDNTGNVVKWQSSVSPFTTWTDIVNTSTTYTSGALTKTTQFRAVVQNGTCTAENSTTTTVTVDPTSVGGTLSGGTTICSGSSSPTMTLSGNTGAVVKWQSSISPFTTWTDIPNTSATYTSGALTKTTQFRAVVQSGVCPTANSGITQVTVNPAPKLTEVAGQDQAICSGSSMTVSVANYTGTIQWQKSNSPSFSPVNNVAGDFDMTDTPTSTTYYRAVVSNSPCPSLTSATVQITVDQPSIAGTVSANQRICSGSLPSTDITISGSVGAIQWESADDAGFTVNTKNDYPNATITTTEIGSLIADKYFRAKVTNGVCPYVYPTTPVKITVDAAAEPNAGLNRVICANDTITLAGNVRGGASMDYTWSAPSGNFSNVKSLTSTYSPTIPSGTVIITLTADDPGDSCPAATSTMTITVNPGPTTTGANICVGGTGSLTSVGCPAGGGTATTDYRDATQGISSTTPTGGTTSWVAWSNPGNIVSNNNTYATISLANANSKSRYLIGTNYGFNIPSTATIKGIQVNIGKFGSLFFGYFDRITDYDVRLVKAGTPVPDGTNVNKAKTATWTGSEVASAYGGTADLWGTTLTPAEINNTGFGVALSIQNKTFIGHAYTASVDYMQISVTYSMPDGTLWYTVSSGGTSIGAGTPFNPVGKTGSGLANTNTPGTYIFYAECTNAPGCRTVANFVITPNNTAGAGSSAPTLCINTALTPITHTTTGATGIGTATSLPAGVSATWTSNTITISGTPTAAGTFNYSIPLTGGCGNINATGTITVKAENAAGTASSTPTLCINTALTAITHTTTGATGIGIATNLPAGVSATWASNRITINGTPTAAGIFSYSIPLTGGCGNVNATGTITVTPNKTSGAASSTPTLCINTALTAITHTTTGATSIGTATNLPAGVSASWSSNTITISGTPTAAGTFNYSIPLTGGCGNVNATGTIIVTPGSTAGAASSTPTLCINTALTAITHITTGATDIGTASNLPAGVSASWSSNTITISGTPTTSGTFNYSIPLTGGCGNVNATGTITVNSNSTAGAASSTPTLCANTALTAVTHSTTGATGIGAASNLPAGVAATWSSNTITISGIPTASGTFNYSIPLTGGCGGVNATGTITVTPNSTTGAASTTPTLCLNTPLTSISHTTTGATGIGTANNLPAGVSASWSSNTITISGTPTSTGIFNYSIPLTGGCGNINATGAITVNAPIAPTVGTITQPSCTVSTGSVVLSSLPAGNWTINPGNLTGSGTSTTISGLITGTINFTVTDAAGCTSLQTQVIISSGNSKQWISTTSNDWFTASNWSPTGVPDANTCVVVPNNTSVVSISGSNKTAYANTLTVTNGGKLDIVAGNNLVVTNSVNVNSGGTLTVQNSSDLIQINNSINTGNISLIRNTPPLVFNDYTYWSSPTTGSQTLRNFSPNSNPKYFLTYNNSWSYINSDNTFTAGIGYAILAPLDANGSAKVFQFTGVPNNGDINLNVASGSTQLVGNPYPSALDAVKFINTNLGNISGTLYFWTHNQPLSGGTYPSGNYAVYNLTGGISNGPGTGNTSLPNGWIASGQGFIVEVASAGKKISFTNDMRSIDVNYANTNFYRNSNNSGTDSSLEKNRIWLNLSSADMFCQALVGYVDKATNSYDPGFDAVDNRAGKIGLYSLMENKKYMIQGRAAFTNNDIVPLGYKTDKGGNLTISIDNVEGIFTGNQDIFIEDKSTHVLQNLKISPYTFITKAGSFDDRFLLRYIDMNLGLNNTVSENITVSTTKNQIEIRSTIHNIKKVFIYDLLGRTIYKNVEIDKNEILISDIKASQQVFILKVVLSNGHMVTKKLFNQ